MKNLYIIILLLALNGCKKSDDGTVKATNVSTVIGANGKIWMDRNLGATQVATSSTDAAAYGDYYQWGRGSDGHQKTTSAVTSTLSTTDQPFNGNFIVINNLLSNWRSPQNDNLWQGVNGVNNPCPSGFRLPTETEWNAEIASWSSKHSAGAFASPLKLPMAGLRSYANDEFFWLKVIGYYWSSTVDGGFAKALFFSSGNSGVSGTYRATGICVRCIKN
jgi:uncharacterized protein (TIGR02145 family)